MTNVINERICFYSSMFRGRSSAEEIINCAKKYGVAGVELMSFCDELRTPDRAEARRLARIAGDGGLVLPCFSVGVDLTGDDREERFAWLRGYAEICSDLEIPYLHHTVASALDPTVATRNIGERVKRGIEMAIRMNEYAATLGVSTIVEDQGFVFNGVSGFDLLYSAAGGRIGTLLDVGNIMFVDERAEDFGRAYSDSIRHVHLKDYKILDTPPTERAYTTLGGRYLLPVEIGTGDVDLRAVARALSDANYGGYLAVEFERVQDLSEVDRVLAHLASVFG